MRALTIRQPWASAIVDLGKDVENRTWRAPSMIGQRFAIHAAVRFVRPVAPALEEIERIAGRQYPARATPLGRIIGVATLVEIVTSSSSPWFTGPFGWVLGDARGVPPARELFCTGTLNFWEMPEHTKSALLRALGE